jgi:activating signal cointegrator complex subunit 2
MAPSLPTFATFPAAPWRDRIVPQEWEACLSLWVSLAEAHLSLPNDDFAQNSTEDESCSSFLVSFVAETSSSGAGILGTSPTATALLRQCFLLTARFLRLSSTPMNLLQWDFLSNFSKLYGKKRVGPLLSVIFKKPSSTPETSLQALKNSLIINLDNGIKGDLRVPEERLKRLNHLIHVSPNTAELFLAGSDFLDGLVNCYKVMNPPLRKIIITTTYLCLIGLTEGEPPNFSMITDQLYSLKAAAEAHKAGPTSSNDSMVAELVTATPILKQVQHRLEESGSSSNRLKSIIPALETFRKPGAHMRPKRLVKRKIGKGKEVMKPEDNDASEQIHVHRVSQISQIQDLFPDLGSGFVSKLLDEYGGNTEEVVAHLLEDSLPPHLANADRKKQLYVTRIIYLVIISGPPLTPLKLTGANQEEEKQSGPTANSTAVASPA